MTFGWLIAESKTIRVICVIAAVLLSVGTSTAQSGRRLPSTNQQRRDDTLRLRAEEVLLNVTVLDEYGRQSTELRKDEFIIAEDGKRQDIASFIVSQVPVNVVLLLDASGSIVSELSFLRDAATHFIEQLGPEDKVCAIEFHTKAELIQDWTSNRSDLRHAISWRFKPGAIPKTGGNTSLYDALYLAADEQLAKVDGRKAIIILTDGLDTSSKLTYERSLEAVIKAGAVVYVVSKARAFIVELSEQRSGLGRVFGNGRRADLIVAEFERAEQLMTDLCSRTGGQIFSPLKDEEMKDVYAQVARELKNQYIITYVSKNEERDGRLRYIRVYLTRPGYSARTRDSYYAPKG